MTRRPFNPADPEPTTRYVSEVLEFARDNPDASDEDMERWTREQTQRLCPLCKVVAMSRYESWNGGCSTCLPAERRGDG